MVEQQNTTNEIESLPKITLSTPIDEIEVLFESILYFYNLKLNGFDLTRDVASQGWESFFDRLKWHVYPTFIKDFWIHAKTIDNMISSFFYGKEDFLYGKIYCKACNSQWSWKNLTWLWREILSKKLIPLSSNQKSKTHPTWKIYGQNWGFGPKLSYHASITNHPTTLLNI